MIRFYRDDGVAGIEVRKLAMAKQVPLYECVRRRRRIGRDPVEARWITMVEFSERRAGRNAGPLTLSVLRFKGATI